MQTVKKSDGTIIADLAVANVDNGQAAFQHIQAGHTSEELQAAYSSATDTLTIVTDGVDGTPLKNYSKLVEVKIVPAATSGAPEDRIYVIMQQLTAAELQKIALKAAVVAGQMTAELYQQITGEAYA